MQVKTVVGLEIHVQLRTRTKIFCGCPNRFNPDQPNTQTCPVCLGLPGALPVLNEEAFRLSLITGTALNCEIATFTKWDRKQYFYPDLPKGYQISQFDLPLCSNGWVEIPESGRRIRIRRAHLEEDAGKNMHDETGRGRDSQVDLNRAGTPLLEIVTEPDLTSSAEAKAFLDELYLLLTYLDVSDCNMQEGSLRCDANVNLHITTGDHVAVTPIVEVKNLNTFRGVEAAIAFEVDRQLAEWQQSGIEMGKVGGDKRTFGWDAERGKTFPQRGKEEASDYRYFPDPDLAPITVTADRIAELRRTAVEGPTARRRRFQSEWGLGDYDANVLVNAGRRTADYFETAARVCGDAKQAANWVTQDVLRTLNSPREATGERWTISNFPIAADLLGNLLKRVSAGELTVKSGREVLTHLLTAADSREPLTAKTIDEIITTKNLKIISDTNTLDPALDAVIAESAQAVADYRNGKQQALGAMIGKVMKQLKGADAARVRARLIEKLR